jgi:molybdopterin synthase sulfur carrier subunit
MPQVVFAPALARWRQVMPGTGVGEWRQEVTASTLREALDEVFRIEPKMRSYVLDDRGALRHHVVAFINGEATRDKQHLDDPLAADAEVYIFQALSGG